MEDLETLRRNIADNLIFYRKQKGLTQLDIADKFNYSDKAVSKWERAEAIPDVYILKQLADLYGITLDDLLSADKKKREKLATHTERKSKITKIFVTILSCALVWCIATTVYIFPIIIIPDVTDSWVVFLYALVINFILLVVFSSIWGRRIYKFISVSGLIWSLFIAICTSLVTLASLDAKIWLLLVIAAAMQVMTILWFTYSRLLFGKNKQDKEDKKPKE